MRGIVHLPWNSPEWERLERLQDEAGVLHRVTKGYRCEHLHVRLDDTAHRVYCRDCDAEVDAYDFLTRLQGEWQRWVNCRKSAETQARHAQERLDELLRQEKNAKARMRRLK